MEISKFTVTELLLPILAALGFGGIIGAYFQSIFQRQSSLHEDAHKLKRQRYGCILILMLTKLDPKTGLPHMGNYRPDVKKEGDVNKEIEIELLNGVLYASDDVLKTMARFLKEPNYAAYIKTAAAMRRDLWHKKTSIDEKTLEVFGQSSTESILASAATAEHIWKG